MEQKNFTFGMLVAVIRRRFKLLVIIGLIAIVGSVIFSGPTFISPKYKSHAIVYPINLEPYGAESLTEQLLQLYQGNDVRDSIIEKFNLVEVYELDPEDEGFRYQLNNEYHDHVVVSRTNFESVRIEVYDKDPVRAKQIADEMINQINYKARKMRKGKAMEHLEVAKNQMNYQRTVLDSINGILSELRQDNGLLDYQLQTERVTEGYLQMLSQTNVNPAHLDEVRTMLTDLGEKGGLFMALSQMSDLGNENYNQLFIHYQGILKEVNQELSYVNVVAQPEVADKKTYPVRWLIVVTATLSALLAALVILLLFEKRQIKD